VRRGQDAHVDALSSRCSPTGRTAFSWMTRNSLTCMCNGRSAISSRNRVPPSADWMSPFLSLTAPVKLPRLCPKSSLSMSSVGIAPQFTGTKGPSRRGPLSWISFATNSLPVPDSPKMCTGAWLRATRAIISRSLLHGGGVPSRRGPKRWCRAFRVPVSLMALPPTWRRPQVERLRDEVESAELQRAYRGLHVAVRGDHRDRHVGRFCWIHATSSRPSPSGRLHVGQTQIELLGLEQRCAAPTSAAVRGFKSCGSE
jgi:hypothetical protein